MESGEGRGVEKERGVKNGEGGGSNGGRGGDYNINERLLVECNI